MGKKNKGASRISRRDALKNIGLAAGAAAVPAWLAGCGEPESAVPLKTGPLSPDELPVETVVCVMMENRSFDHYFASLRIDEGRDDVLTMTKDTFNEDEEGNKFYPKVAQRFCVEDPPHGFGAGITQFDGGTNGGFVKAHMKGAHGDDVQAATVMDYLNRSHLPFLYDLSDDFTLCQRWFASVRSSTWPNRWYLHGAQSNGETTNNFGGTYDFEMIYDRLVAKGLTFKYYYTDVPFLALSEGFRERHPRMMRPLREFFLDAENGELPNYCMVDPGFNLNDDHPPHHPTLGQQFLSTVYHSLAASPQWERSMFFVTYDECGGFFDHVPPPTVEDRHAGKGLGPLGFRVPGIVAGPYVKQQVSDVQYDHCSVLAFLNWHFDLEPLTERDAGANNFVEDVLDVDRIRRRQPRKAPVYEPVVVPEEAASKACNYDLGSLSGAPHDMHIAASIGLIPKEYDLRPQRAETLRFIAEIEGKRLVKR
jgi:phospholipase C